jgi:hypothetical protein
LTDTPGLEAIAQILGEFFACLEVRLGIDVLGAMDLHACLPDVLLQKELEQG